MAEYSGPTWDAPGALRSSYVDDYVGNGYASAADAAKAVLAGD